ncbi:MAG TPA: beta-ketoacyl synthase N-terminal-like domain-containing protein [Oligoflexus sp.]|uniref:beta-ketoacyl synthase N-terminal-like domain-containing protein n=1 Tax=Oligoflexus sp. TaxID=1971216 RepID=UPI002D2A7B80|nr:beta-ketoacyl synthase N-terminal-like domain-containing protein [Oligoflexus sp.]HYX34074.1 beta-ketoacyl synthase N-terminal-like domain-containing protein [Oligoflexus sp.]
MDTPRLYITAADLISPAGWGSHVHLDGLLSDRCFLQNEAGTLQGRLPEKVREALHRAADEKGLKHQDPLTRLAVLLVRSLAEKSRIAPDFGVIFGSSRGPTHLLESSIIDHHEQKRLSPLTSPTTTASSLSAAVARELGLEGPSLFISAACSTGLHAVIQAAGSIRLGLAKGMIAGGAEFSNTDYTLEILQAARVYADHDDNEYPCRPGADDRGGMVLSEGAAAVVIDSDPWMMPLGELVGWGAATEKSTLTGISSDGAVLVKAIRQALDIAQLEATDIDLIVGHGAGTKKGDAAELAAYEQIFNESVPIVFHKWMYGHMLGASACASLILGMYHLNQGVVPPHPYLNFGDPRRAERRLSGQRHLLVTALGFGGNAAALIVKNPALSQV